jgi:GNAT superfamily N-acetyltransferase
MEDAPLVRLVSADEPDDLAEAAQLLHDFNLEFDAASPGPGVLAIRLGRLLAGGSTLLLLADRPATGLALVTLRPNVWHDGPVALLDELYVQPGRRDRGIGAALLAAVRAESRRRAVEVIEINVDEPDVDARRFYERHGFTAIDPDTGDRALYYYGPADP